MPSRRIRTPRACSVDGRSVAVSRGWPAAAVEREWTRRASGVPAAEDDAPHPSPCPLLSRALLGFRAGGLGGLLLLGRPLAAFRFASAAAASFFAALAAAFASARARLAACSAASCAGVFTISAGTS